MWENETVVLVTSLKKRIMGGKDKVRFGKINADNAIPPFIKTLFQKQVEEFIVKELPLSVRPTPHFDLQHGDIEILRGRFLDVLREAASFSFKEVEDVLRTAIILRLDYLVKPSDTMRRLLFDKNESIELREIEEVLNPFIKVLPCADLLIKEIRRLGYSAMERDEYGKIITDLLHRMMGENPIKVILHDFSSLTDFLSETKGEEVSKVDSDVLQEFLADRNQWGFRRALEVETKLGKEEFNAADLEMTLKRYQELKAEFSTPMIVEEKKSQLEEISLKSTFQEEEIKPIIKKTSIPEKVEKVEEEVNWDFEDVLIDEPIFLNSEVKGEEPEKKTTEEPKSKKQMRIIRRDQKEDEKEDLEPIKAISLSESSEQLVPQGGLRSFIDDKTRKGFIKKLFGGETEGYEHLLDKLEEADSWRVAKILIDNELFKRDVDPFSREAIKLVDIIYSRYYPEEGVGGKL